ncbi:MAG: aryl-sulfate sulfotransferase, partial [Aurantibacter sp.]
ITIGGIGGRIERKDWNDNLIWEYTYSTSQLSHHHDIYPMPNGNILILAVTRKSMAETLEAGRDPANLPGGELYNEQIIEITPTGSNGATIVWEWNIWDHLIQDFDSTKNNFGDVSENPQLLDINYLGFSGGGTNWIHVNSIQYNAEHDQIVLSARQLNEFYIIDHSTTTSEASGHSGGSRNMGGDILYRWGNPEAYQQGTVDDQKLFGQHFSHWIPDNYPDAGKIIVYNNGSGRQPFFSSVDIIDPPTSAPGEYLGANGGAFGPSQAEYSYTDPDNREDFFSLILSSAQRLPNGNTLICEGTNGRFFEINENEETVWEYINPDTRDGILSQGDTPPTGNNVFRVLRYSLEYPAFDGKDLTPGNPIEANPNLGACTLFDDAVTVIIEDASSSEGGVTDFTVSLTNESAEDITLTFSFNDQTTNSDDYSNSDIQLTIPAGETSATLTITTSDDTLDEIDEEFEVYVKSVDSGSVDNSSDTAIGTILDNDPEPDLSIQDAEALEEMGVLSFQIDLSNPSGDDIVISFEVIDISTDATDYLGSDLQLTIPAGTISAGIDVPINSDEVDEPNETFSIHVSSLDSGRLGNFGGAAIGTILNDDFMNASPIFYPVPVVESLTVHWPNNMKTIEVFNLSGAIVAKVIDSNSIDLSTLSAGVYVVRAESAEGITMKKIMVR